MSERLQNITPLKARGMIENNVCDTFSLESKSRHPDLYTHMAAIGGPDFEKTPDILDPETFRLLREARDYDLLLIKASTDEPVARISLLLKQLAAENPLLGQYLGLARGWQTELRYRTDRIVDILCPKGPFHPTSASARSVTGRSRVLLAPLAMHEKRFAGPLKKNEAGHFGDFVLRKGHFAPPDNEGSDEEEKLASSKAAPTATAGTPKTQGDTSTKIEPLDPEAAKWEALDNIQTITLRIEEVRMELEWMEKLLELRPYNKITA